MENLKITSKWFLLMLSIDWSRQIENTRQFNFLFKKKQS